MSRPPNQPTDGSLPPASRLEVPFELRYLKFQKLARVVGLDESCLPPSRIEEFVKMREAFFMTDLDPPSREASISSIEI